MNKIILIALVCVIATNAKTRWTKAKVEDVFNTDTEDSLGYWID